MDTYVTAEEAQSYTASGERPETPPEAVARTEYFFEEAARLASTWEAFHRALAGIADDPSLMAPNCRCSGGLARAIGEAETRAQEILERFLTVGERDMLERFGAVPVVPANSNLFDLILVTPRLGYNVLVFWHATVPRRFLPGKKKALKALLGCLQQVVLAPAADRMTSLVLAFRSDPVGCMKTANWFSTVDRTFTLRGSRVPIHWLEYVEPALRHLADSRCEDSRLRDCLIRNLERSTA